MPCIRIEVDGKFIGWACGPGLGKRCSVPGCSRQATKMCDFPTAKGTCDKALCNSHAVTPIGYPNADYCPPHARHTEGSIPGAKQLGLFEEDE